MGATVAGEQPRPVRADVRERADAVPLRFEDPVPLVGHVAADRGKHRSDRAIQQPKSQPRPLTERERRFAIEGDNDMDESTRETNDELERWRRAAEVTFEQLEWVIGYLRSIGKTREARALAANRRVIRRELLERPAEPLPSDRVHEPPPPSKSQDSGGSNPATKSGGNSSKYEAKTKKELQQEAAKVGIEGRSKMDKGELIDALRNH
jgi:hypothetical protein